MPAQQGIGLEGPGVIIYGAAIATLVLLDIGYMRGRWGFFLDSPRVYLVLGLVGGAALLYRGWELWSVGYLPLPQQSPGPGARRGGRGQSRRAGRLYGAGMLGACASVPHPPLRSSIDPAATQVRAAHGSMAAETSGGGSAAREPRDDHGDQQRAEDQHRAQVGPIVARGAARRPGLVRHRLRSRRGTPGGPARWRRGWPRCRPG